MSVWSWLRESFARAPKPTSGHGLPDQSLWEQFRRIGGSLTPSQVSSIIRQADGGNLQPLIDLSNDARQKDCTLQSVLGTREKAIAGLGWALVYPGQDPTSTRGNRQRMLVEGVLRSSVSFDAAIEHLAGGAYPGHAVVENVWAKSPSGKLIIASFKNQPARRFGYRPTDGAFVWEDLGNVASGKPMADFPAGNFAISHPRINGDVPCREGLARVLMWAALFRNWTISDWLKLGEIGWKPWRRGIYKKSASQEDIDNLNDILSSMSASGYASYPETTEVHVEWPSGQGMRASHAELFDVVGREMAKAVLGQTLTSDQGRVGSQALGKVHNEVRHDILEADAKHVASVITRDIVAPLVRYNFGDSADVPAFVFITEDKEDIAAFGDGVGKLRKAGLRIGAKWVRDQVGMPEPEEGEEMLGDGEGSHDETDSDEEDSTDKPADDEADDE